MYLRSIRRVTGSLALLHLVHHAGVMAEPAVAPSSSGAQTRPEVTSASPEVTPAASSTLPGQALPDQAPPTGSQVVPPEPQPASSTGPVNTTPPTAQFEAVTPIPEASVPNTPPATPPAESNTTTNAPKAAGEPSSTPNVVNASVLPEERLGTQSEINAFDESRAALNSAQNYDPVEFRQREVPGDYVARPVTLPEGTFELTLNNHVAFMDAAEVVGWVPSFALGITSSFEVGMSAPLRYNESLQDWTKLDPVVHVAQQWLDEPEIEAAARLAVLIPLTSKSDPQLELGLPFLWHATSALRIDAGLSAIVALEKPVQAALNVPLGATLQATSWLFTGLSATPNLGLTNQRKFGLDAAARLGVTLQSRGSAQVDLVATLFAENVGTGRDGQTTDGVGTTFTAAFYPEIY